MSLYKIRINCTTKKELTFNDKPINKKYTKNIYTELQPLNIDYIDGIIILYKHLLLKRTLKSLEFLVNIQLTDILFIEFINKLKDVGFNSKNDKPRIQFIDNTGNIIYNYNFDTCLPLDIKKYKNKKNKSSYSQLYLYKK